MKLEYDPPSIEAVNSWRNLAKLGPDHQRFYKNLYINKLKKRIIKDIPERRKSKIVVDGVEVWLPIASQDGVQDWRRNQYIQKVIEACKGKQNALLESPIGAGKTLALLSAVVAFIKMQETPTTLIYCTRSASHSSKVARKLNQLAYQVQAQVLAPKQQLCAFIDDRSDEQQLEIECSQLRLSRPRDHGDPKKKLEPNLANELRSGCPFYCGEEMQMSDPSAFSEKRFNPVIDLLSERIESRCMDVEELAAIGKQKGICPYYFAKSKVGGADVLVVPYQYLLEAGMRKQLQINLRNSVIVFDDAHNIDSDCEDVFSFDVQIEHFWDAFHYLDTFSKQMRCDQFCDFMLRKQVTHLKCFLLRLNNALKAMNLQEYKNALGSVQKCITNIFILDLEDFINIVDKLLLETGEKYDIVFQEESDYQAIQNRQTQENANFAYDQRAKISNEYSESNCGAERNKKLHMQSVQPEYGGIATLSTFVRDFQLQEGFRSKQIFDVMEAAVPFETCQHTIQEEVDDAEGILTTKNGKKVMQFRKNEEDIKDEELSKLLESAYACIQEAFDDEIRESLPKSKVTLIIDMLEKIRKIKKLMHDFGKSVQDMCDFKCYIRTNRSYKSKGLDHHITQFGVHCLNPSYVFRQLVNDPNERPRSVILTSGTLSPMWILYSELKTHFKIKLANEQYVEPQQMFASIVSTDYYGNPFKFNFENQDIRKSFRDLGRFVYRINKCIQGGILMFFTSQTHIQECYRQFCESGINFDRTKIFIEDKDAQQSMLNYNAYLANVKLLNKGIFMCLSRGKMSEQLDYKDNLARACLIIGIPYLLVNDPRVNLKKTYLDDRHEIESELTMLGYKTNNDPKSTQQITGDYWYKMTAIREVNQLVGRCIKHQNDYTSVFLIDERYEKPNIKKKLAKWIQQQLRVFKSINNIEDELLTFNRQNQLKALNNMVNNGKIGVERHSKLGYQLESFQRKGFVLSHDYLEDSSEVQIPSSALNSSRSQTKKQLSLSAKSSGTTTLEKIEELMSLDSSFAENSQIKQGNYDHPQSKEETVRQEIVRQESGLNLDDPDVLMEIESFLKSEISADDRRTNLVALSQPSSQLYEMNPNLLNYYLSQVSVAEDFKPDTGATSSPPWKEKISEHIQSEGKLEPASEYLLDDEISSLDKTLILGGRAESEKGSQHYSQRQSIIQIAAKQLLRKH